MKLKKFDPEFGEGYSFRCPGCGTEHVVFTASPDPYGYQHPTWQFNGDVDRPTFSPSLRVGGVRHITDDERDRIMRGEHVEPEPFCCHSFIRDGRIEFCADSTHQFAGKTLDLPEIELGTAP